MVTMLSYSNQIPEKLFLYLIFDFKSLKICTIEIYFVTSPAFVWNV